jgi:hexokinase
LINTPCRALRAKSQKKNFLKRSLIICAWQKRHLSFCFSYAIEPLDDKDCRVLEIRKQLSVKGLLGERIGFKLNEELQRRRLGPKHIIVFNDSVSTLLAGRAAVADDKFDGFIGFILGTGTNTSYIEDISKITKVSRPELTGSMLISTESGGYGLFHIPKLVKLFDAGTADPGKYVYEKMISGKYQGPLALCAIKTAGNEGLFSASFLARVNALKGLEASEVDRFMDSEGTEGTLYQCLSETSENYTADRQRLIYLLDLIAEHTSALVTVNLAAILEKGGKRKSDHPVYISLDGSVCIYSKTFMNKLNINFKQYVLDKLDIRSEFIHVEDASLLGAAIAGLIN